MNSQKLTILD
jgi:hypothetical protein